MHSMALLIIGILVCQPSLMAAYKILVSSHTTEKAASKAKERTEDVLFKNSYYQAHRNNEHYTLRTYPIGGYFVVAIEPIQSEKVLNALLGMARQINRNAFASYVTKPSSQDARNESAPKPPASQESNRSKSAAPSFQDATPSRTDTSKYLRHKPKPVQESATPYYLYIAIAVLLLLTILLSFWLFRLKQRLSQTAQSEAAFHEPEISNQQHNTYRLTTDIHSHLIPGIDDGVKHIDEAMELIKHFHQLGYQKIITTPHIMSHRYANSSKILLSGLEILRERAAHEGIDIEIDVASEYFLDEHLMNLVAEFDILTFGNNYLLFEMSYINHPANLEAMIEVMTEAGYTPVLAHPERYVYMAKNFSKYAKLKKLGVLFQLNINSIAGYYSEEVKRLALRLVDAGMIDFIGSDVHHARHMQSMENVMKTEAFRRIFQKNTILNHTL